MTRNARVVLSWSSDRGKGVGEEKEWKASGVTVGGTGEKTGGNAVKRESSKGRFSGKDSLNCGSVAIAVQRGNVMSYLEGYDRSLYLMSRRSLAEMGDGGESDESDREE